MSGLLASNLTVAAGTAASRITGMLRIYVIAAVLGGTVVSDAYFLANETPNIVYDLLIGGVLSATLVPLFTTYLNPENTDADQLAADRERQRATNVIITTAVAAMILVTVIAMVAAPLIFRLYSLDPTSIEDPDLYRRVGTMLARVFLVQILFYGVTGVANAYLNSRRKYFAAAWSPVVPNLIIIAAFISLPDADGTPWTLTDVITNDRLRWTLGLGATLGIASMALIVAPAMVRAGLRYRPVIDLKHPAVSKLVALSGWTLGFVISNQIATVVVRNLLDDLDKGAQTAYTYAFTFFMLPYGLLAVSVATTFQPELARAVTNRSRERFLNNADLGIRSVAALTIPAAAAMIVMAGPIIGTMKRGEYDANDVAAAADALRGLAIGLVAFSVYLFSLRGFYAHQDTRTPFIINLFENAVHIVLAILFVRWWGMFGLGLAYAVAYMFAAWFSLTVLRNKTKMDLAPLMSSLWRLLLAGVLAMEAMWLVTNQVAGDTGWHGIAQLVVGGLVGATVFGAILMALKSPEVAIVWRIAARLRRPAKAITAQQPPQPTR